MIRNVLLGLGVLLSSAFSYAQGNNKVNILVAPVGLAFESAQVGADFVVAENMTLGVRYTRADTNLDQVTAQGNALGIVGRFFLTNQAMAGGYYLSPAVTFPDYDLTAEIEGDSGSAQLTEPIYQVTAGHQWMWENFNINLGLGVSHITAPDNIEVARADGSVDTVAVPAITPAGELTMGWAF